jgi:hypothetical protein
LTIKSAQHTKNSPQFSVCSSQQETLSDDFAVHYRLLTVHCPSRRSPFASPPGSTPSRASTGRHRTISCQRTLSIERDRNRPRPHFQLGLSAFASSPEKLGLILPPKAETSNSTSTPTTLSF